MTDGKNFLIRLVLWTSAILMLAYWFLGKSVFTGYIEFLEFAYELEDSTDPDEAMAIFSQIGAWMGAFSLLMLVSWCVMASAETAFHKRALFDEDKGLFPLRFGVSELRVMLAQLVVLLSCSGVYLGGIFLMVLLMALGGALGQVSGILTAIFMIIGILGVIAAMIYTLVVLVRLSPAAALSVRDSKIRLFQGWKMTKGRIWPMIGSYLIVYLIGYVATYAAMLIVIFIAFGDLTAFEAFSGVSDDNPAEVFAALGAVLGNPRVYIPLILGSALLMVMYIFWYICMWGIPNYLVALDMRREEVFD